MISVLLLAVLVAPAAPQRLAKPAPFRLPMEWTVGSEHRYRATWVRDYRFSQPGAPANEATVQQEAEITVSVAQRNGGQYRLRWQPRLERHASSPRRPGDLAAGGTELWRRALGLPLDLALEWKEGSSVVTVLNAIDVRNQMSAGFRAMLRESGIDLECEGRDAGTAACTVTGDQADAGLVQRHAAVLFACSGLELDPTGPAAWTERHSLPDMPLPLSLRYRREVIAFDSASPSVQVRTTAEPDPDELKALVRRQLGEGPVGSKELADALSGWTFRVETTCTMDRRSGWPLVIEQRTSGGVGANQGSETARFTRIEPAGTRTPDAPRRRN